MSIINWTQYRPATRVNNFRGTYLELPAFSLDTGIVWKGASEVVMQFNYSAAKDFVLLSRPTKPSGCNFGLCIRYRVGDSVTRYKLWEDDAFILSGVAAPLYSGERIRANFVLEIWSFEALTEVSLDEAIRMTTSVRNNITSLSARSVESFVTGEEFTDLGDLGAAATFPTLNLLQRYSAGVNITGGATVTSWSDQDADNALAAAGLVNPPTYTAVNVGINNKPSVDFVTTNDNLVSVTGTFNFAGVVAVVRNNNPGTAGQLFYFEEAATPKGGIIESTPAPDLVYSTLLGDAINSDVTSDTWRIIAGYSSERDGTWYVNFDTYNMAGELVSHIEAAVAGEPDTVADLFALGNFGGALSAEFSIADFCMFSEYVSGAILGAVNFYAQYYGTLQAISLPMTFNTGSPWEDNDEL